PIPCVFYPRVVHFVLELVIPINPNLKNEQMARHSSRPWRSNIEYTKNGVHIYIKDRYKSVYSYQARVIAQGEFYLPPSYSELMYQPEVRARSASNVLSVSDTRQKVTVPDWKYDNEKSETERTLQRTSSSKKSVNISPILVAILLLLFVIFSYTFIKYSESRIAQRTRQAIHPFISSKRVSSLRTRIQKIKISSKQYLHKLAQVVLKKISKKEK
ncbi:MAG: hypothetical protein ACOCXQ_01090, partial [Patescibacteria group bacterium]